MQLSMENTSYIHLLYVTTVKGSSCPEFSLWSTVYSQTPIPSISRPVVVKEAGFLCSPSDFYSSWDMEDVEKKVSDGPLDTV